MAATLSQRARPTRDVLVSDLNREMVMLDLASEQYFGLDAVGRDFWDRVTVAPSLADALAELEAAYDIDRETLSRDLLGLVDKLEAKGLLVLSDAKTA